MPERRAVRQGHVEGLSPPLGDSDHFQYAAAKASICSAESFGGPKVAG
jgi:hypothetical protein